MFNLFQHNSLIDKSTLSELLDINVSSKIKERGLVKQSDYLWYTPDETILRQGLKYNLLKGEQGTFTWGVCLNFVPLPSGSNLTYANSVKKYVFHLFEWPDEYSNSFFGGNLKNAVANHWDKNKAGKSINRLFARNESRIFKWLQHANSLENIIEIAQNQAQAGRQYDFHYPHPKYVLAFLYAKKHQKERAIHVFDSLDINVFTNEEVRDKAKKKLINLTEDRTND